MEKEIGSIPDRNGFEVHVEGEEITVTQYNGDSNGDSSVDLITLHFSDAEVLINLLAEAVSEILVGDEGIESKACGDPPSEEVCDNEHCCPPPGTP